MDTYTIMFYFFAFVTVASAFSVVTTKNVIYAAFNLMLTFFGVAGIYVLLGADFIAIVQLIVYVGGILILLIFGVMLTNKITDAEIKGGMVHTIPALVVVTAFFGVFAGLVYKTSWRVLPQLQQPQSGLADMGKLLVNEYALIFEVLGALLLIALIGAASIARK